MLESPIIVRPARDIKDDLAAARALLLETFAFHAQVAGSEPGLMFQPAAQDSYLEDCLWSIREAANGKIQSEQTFLAWQPEKRLFPLKPQEKAIGLLMVRVQRDNYYSINFYGYIEQLIVTEQARHLGAGTMLLNAACEWLLSRQIHTATLKVYGPNLDAVRFYQREGFDILRHELIKHF